ncbi:putative calcium/proton exchanger [Helianthus debilis subsp. tardiflorus]
MAQNSLILITILVFFTVATASRHISATNSSTNLVSEVSDGFRYGHEGILTLSSSTNELELCDQTYGFMPCTTSVLGNLFLISVYGYLMFLAATYLSAGSELMLEILGPGIVGGLFLPILGALPDALLILGTKTQTL